MSVKLELKTQHRGLTTSLLLISGLCFTATTQAKPETIYEDRPVLVLALGAIQTDYLNPTFEGEESGLAPTLQFTGELMTRGEGTQYLFDYDANFRQWQADNEVLTYDDSPSQHDIRVRGLARLFLTDEWQVDVEAQHFSKDEMFASGLSRLRKDVPVQDHITLNSGFVSLLYGTNNQQRYASLKLGIRDREYDDNNAYATQFNALESIYEAELGYALSPATQFIVNVGLTSYDFEQPQLEDSVVYKTVAGVSWIASAASTMRVVVGGYYRNFDVQPSSSGFLGDFLYEWKPSNRFSMSLRAKREATATQNEFSSDSILSDASIFLNYRFSVRWATSLLGSYELNEYDESVRGQDLTEYNLSSQLTFSFSSYQSITVKYSYKSVATRDAFIDYEQSQIGIHWQYEF